MLTTVRKVLGFEMTIAEWIGTAIILGVPYLIIGMFWALIRVGSSAEMHGATAIMSFLGSVVAWPAFLLVNVCMN